MLGLQDLYKIWKIKNMKKCNDSIDIFDNNKESLKNISFDEINEVNMTGREDVIINFDSVKTEYASKLGVRNRVSKSVDGLIYSEDTQIFIEFKNTKVKSKEIKEKMKDSLLIYCDITNK